MIKKKKKAQGRPPTTSWPGDVPAPSGPGKVFNRITRETLERTPIPLGNWVHPYQPGDEVWVNDWKKKKKLQPVWTGPHIVVLANLIAVRFALDPPHQSQEGRDFLC